MVPSSSLTRARPAFPAVSPPTAGAAARAGAWPWHRTHWPSGAGSQTYLGWKWCRQSAQSRHPRPGTVWVRDEEGRSAGRCLLLRFSPSEGWGTRPWVTDPE